MRNCGFIRLPNSNFGYNINIASLFPPPPLSLCIEDELNCGIFHGIQKPFLIMERTKIMAIPYFVNMSSCDSNMHPWAKSRRRTSNQNIDVTVSVYFIINLLTTCSLM